MDERIQKALDERLQTEKSYEARALLFSVEQYILHQEQRLKVQAGMLDGAVWDHRKW